MNNGLGLSDNDHGGRATGQCARGGDLLAYLYNEATVEESRFFTRHLDSCAVCRDELVAFGGVRERVGAWRDEVMSGAPKVDLSGALSQAPATSYDPPARRRRARVALREFFALSPLWLRAGTATAALVVCALAALVLARTEMRWDDNGVSFRAGVPTRTTVERVEVPAPDMLNAQQADEMARRRVDEALEAQRVEFARELERAVVNARGEAQIANRPAPLMVNDVRQTSRGRSVVRKRPNSRGLEDVRGEEEGLPGLYDLLREAN
ncbi:MAG TPA: hypothetical protein VF240_02255 [Pyrinomonadaceae bacterium]